MGFEPNRDPEQPVEAKRDAMLGEEPLGGALLPVGGPGNDPDADKVGDDEAEVDSHGPSEEDARDRMIPAAGAAGSNAPYLAPTLRDGYADEAVSDSSYPEDVRG